VRQNDQGETHENFRQQESQGAIAMLDRELWIERHNRKWVVKQVPRGNRTLTEGLFVDNTGIKEFDTQEEAVDFARKVATREQDLFSTQVRVRHLDGTFDEIGTYPRSADPRRSRG
jgi:hypothetical protein